ncbi:MAG: protease complex subunit PrcB family protein [Methylococcaceae bacterium]|jgi:hypothetical protein
MRTQLCIAAITLLLTISGPSAQPSLTYTPIENGTQSGITTRGFHVIRHDADFAALWQAHTAGLSPTPTAPALDFSKKMLIWAFAGSQPNGGYRLEMTGVTHTKNRIVVSLRLLKPGEDCVVSAMMGQPFVMIALPASDWSVDFDLRESVSNCQAKR